MKYKVFYKEDKSHEIELENNQIRIDGKDTDIDLVKLLCKLMDEMSQVLQLSDLTGETRAQSWISNAGCSRFEPNRIGR